ncbi:hypothetical protein [Chryseobacterium sp. MFBS3-17]|uniref:hypothetical protein n=1 Tax=Chryseobacterium sp. MFBS3-17 TaxID=2886689 RepID=UPI001D0F3BFD|nr:hypothetical protein [Chryseobacterium sp. MFBS3-17]MCC2590613.1 hypothetical protein [Chryseobacterium sp. MFBS3-17]
MNKLTQTFLLLVFLVFTSIAGAQTVKIKKDEVFVDNELRFKSEKRLNATQFSLYHLTNGKEILTVIRNLNGTIGFSEDDYIQIIFNGFNTRVESEQIKGRTFAWYLELLLRDKVLHPDGTINEENLRNFFTKYDQNITNRTLRY